MHVSWEGGMYFSGGYKPYKILGVHVIYTYIQFTATSYFVRKTTLPFRNIVVRTHFLHPP